MFLSLFINYMLLVGGIFRNVSHCQVNLIYSSTRFVTLFAIFQKILF